MKYAPLIVSSAIASSIAIAANAVPTERHCNSNDLSQPIVQSVRVTGSGRSRAFDIFGQNFSKIMTPYIGNSQRFALYDVSNGVLAGWRTNGLTLVYASSSRNNMFIGGFGARYGQPWTFESGDVVDIYMGSMANHNSPSFCWVVTRVVLP